MRRTLLVTGFGPFPGWERNPTPALVRAVAALRLPGLRIVPHVFATVYKEVARDLPALIDRHRPDAVLMFGLAGRTRHVRVERYARNITSQRTPDASDAFHARIEIGAGPARLETRLATRRIALAMSRAGLAALPSPSAGEYLCNYAYYLALEAVAARRLKAALFVHVPMPVAAAGHRPRGAGTARPHVRRLDAPALAKAAAIAARAITGR